MPLGSAEPLSLDEVSNHFRGVGAHPVSLIKRCWYAERGCLESSTCSDLRKLYDKREVVDELPLDDEMCKTPIYISTGLPRHLRNGTSIEGRPETMQYPGEKWSKCCKKKGLGENGSDSLKCVDTEVLDQLKVTTTFDGWCGHHYCVGTRDRCLKVGAHKEFLSQPKAGKCPSSCKGGCDMEKFKLECIFTGVEPKLGTEGKAQPTASFGEPVPYQVFSLASLGPNVPSSAPLFSILAPPSAELHESPMQAPVQQRAEWANFLAL